MKYYPLVTYVIVIFLLSCANPWAPDKNESTDFSLSYTVHLPELNPDSLMIRIEIDQKPDHDNSFVLPLVYFDNPLDSMIRPMATNLHITDAAGQELDTTSRLEQIGPTRSTVFTIPSSARYPVTIQYNIDFDAVVARPESFGMPQMHVSAQSALMMGAYIFAVPYEQSLPRLWRKQRAIQVHFDLPPSQIPIGLPSNSFAVSNVYELLFIQLALGTTEVGSGIGGNQPFSLHLVNGDGGGDYTWAPIQQQCATILDSIVPLFGTLSDETYHILFYPIGGGLEGTYSFFTALPSEAMAPVLPMIIAHEIYHHTIGIRCGEYDDPWWKEGTAEYLGWLTAGRCGYATLPQIYNSLIGAYTASETIGDYPPSSEVFRPLIFYNSLHHIAYGKGGQINMLLDLAVREQNNNELNLQIVTADLVHQFNHDAYTRNQLIDHFSQTAGVDIEPILEAYADTAGKIPLDILDDAFRGLAQMGAFGTDTSTGFLSKRRAVERDHTPELFFHY